MNRESKLAGKTILFVNSGGKKKRFTLEIAKKLGLKIVLINARNDAPKRLVDHFIKADTFNHREVIEKVGLFIEENPSIHLDGVITFWEDDIPLVGRLVEHFKFIGNNYETAINTRNKYEMRKRFAETGLGSPEFRLIQTNSDLQEAISRIGFPAVMKPAWGADSEFVVLVSDEDEAESTFEYLRKNCNEQFNPIFKYNSGLFLYEQYVSGMELSVEAFSQYGIPQVLGINEKLPITPPYFIEHGDIAPARISEDQQYEVQKLAEAALIALGVKNSLAHVELKVTPQGPKLIEVASRMGGDDVYLNVKNVWDTDMIKIGLQIACGEKVEFKPREPKEHVVCKYFIPPLSGVITNILGAKELKNQHDVVDLVLSKEIGDSVFVPPEGFESMGWVITRGNTYQEAQSALERVFRTLQINVTPYHKRSSLGKTNRKDALSSASLVRRQIIRAAKIEKIKRLDPYAIKNLHIGVVCNSKIPRLDESFEENPRGEEIYKGLRDLDYNVSLIDMSESPLPLKLLQEAELDLVLNLCDAIHNSTSMEPHAAALLEILQLPYTGSGPAAITQCLDKITIKKLLNFHEIPTPAWDCMYTMDDSLRSDLNFPLIVKPANTDNSFGISNESVVTNRDELMRQVEKIIVEYKRPALIEEYIDGDEFDVCILGNNEDIKVLPIIRSVFDEMPKGYWHIYGAEAKSGEKHNAYDLIEIERPARISAGLAKLLTEMSLDVYNMLDLRDYGKVEIRVDRYGNPYVLEINPNPPLGRDDFLALSAGVDGYSYESLIEELLYITIQRFKGSTAYNFISQQSKEEESTQSLN